MFTRTTLLRAVVVLLGILLVGTALLIPGDIYGRLLTADGQKDFAWGPALFRVLLFAHGLGLIFLGLLIRRPGLTPAAAESTSGGLNISEWLFLSALSAVALLLRLWHLNSDLWVDEVLTLIDFVRSPFGEMVTSFPSQNQHMLYSILAHASINVFGESPWSFRLPAVLFGVASIWALYLLCRHLLGIRAAVLGASLMTFSYHHIWFSQNARGYTGLLFFTLLGTWCWLRAIENNHWDRWIAYSAVVVFGMWIHMTMAFVVAAHFITYSVYLMFPRLSGASVPFERKAGLRPIVAWILAVTVTLQLYALALPEFLRVGLHEESAESEWTNPLWLISESLNGLRIGFAGGAAVLLGGLLVGFGWLRLFRRNPRAAVLMVLPAILAGTTMLAMGHNLWPRFFFFSMGFGILITIYGALEIPSFLAGFSARYRRRTQIAAYAGVALAILMITASAYTLPRNYALPKQDFSGAKDYVVSNRLPGDAVAAVTLAGTIYGSYLAPDWTVVKSGAELQQMAAGENGLWLVYTLPIELRSVRPDIWEVINQDFEVVQVFPGTLNGGEVFVCRNRTLKETVNGADKGL